MDRKEHKNLRAEAETQKHFDLVDLKSQVLRLRIEDDLKITPDDPSLNEALEFLETSDSSHQRPDLTYLQAAARYYKCPTPKPHSYINGEVSLEFEEKPNHKALAGLVFDVGEIAGSSECDPLFKKYYDVLETKLLSVSLDEMLEDPKINYPKEKLLQTIKTSTKNPKILERVSQKDYDLTINDVRDFAQSEHKRVGKKVKNILNKIERKQKNNYWRTFAINTSLMFSQIFSTQMANPNKEYLFPDKVDAFLLQPDHDPIRKLEAGAEIADFGVYMFQNKDSVRPEIPITKYLSEKENIDGTVRWFLQDYTEALQNFPKERHEAIIQKSINFVNNTSTLYLKGEKSNYHELKEYLLEVSSDEEMQEVLGYTALPFLAYIASNENLASEQLLYQIYSDLDGNIIQLPKDLGQIYKYLSEYKPDSEIKIKFDIPDNIIRIDENRQIKVSQKSVDELNALPINPNYLPPEQFLEKSINEYQELWKNIYGDDSEPPLVHWSPVKEQPNYTNDIIDIYFRRFGLTSEIKARSLHDINNKQKIARNRDGFENNIKDFKAIQKGSAFMRATTTNPDYFTEIYSYYKDSEPDYAKKFSDSSSFLSYYQDNIQFIQQNGSPESPLPESELLGYLLVKCKGNLTYAYEERALTYKLTERYNIRSGKILDLQDATEKLREITQADRNPQAFYRSTYLEENIPLITSISYESIKGQDINKVIPILLKEDIRLIDQSSPEYPGNWYGYELFSKKLDIAEIVAMYHPASQQNLTLHGVANPTAVGIRHVLSEMPFRSKGSYYLASDENSNYKTVILTQTALDNIKLSKYLNKNVLKKYDQPGNLPKIYIYNIDAELISGEKFKHVEGDNYALITTNPNETTTVYFGPQGAVRRLHELGYYPAIQENIKNSENINPDFFVYSAKNGIPLPDEFYSLEKYDFEGVEKVIETIYTSPNNLQKHPENLYYYAVYGYKIDKDTLIEMANQPENHEDFMQMAEKMKNETWEDNAYDQILGIFESRDTVLKNSIYFTLPADYRKKVDQIYPDVKGSTELPESATGVLINQIEQGQSFNQIEAGKMAEFLLDEYDEYVKTGNKLTPPLIKAYMTLMPQLSYEEIQESINELGKRELLVDYYHIFKNYNPEIIEYLYKENADNPDIQFSLLPARIYQGNIDTIRNRDEIDRVVTSYVSQNEPDYILVSELLSAYYNPSEEVKALLVSESQKFIEANDFDKKNMYTAANMIARYGSDELFLETLNIIYKHESQQEYVNNRISGNMIYDRYRKFVTANPYIKTEMAENDIATFGAVIDSPIFKTEFLVENENKYWYYKEYRELFDEKSATSLYLNAGNDMSEIARFSMYNDIVSRGYTLPEFVTNKEKLANELKEEPSFQKQDLYLLFDSKSRAFIKNNFTMESLVDLSDKHLEGLLTESTLLDNDGFFDHEFLTTLDGYTPELESKLVENMSQVFWKNVDERPTLPDWFLFFVPYLSEADKSRDYKSLALKYFNTHGKDFDSMLMFSTPEGIEVIKNVINLLSKEDIEKIKTENPDSYEAMIKILDQ